MTISVIDTPATIYRELNYWSWVVVNFFLLSAKFIIWWRIFVWLVEYCFKFWSNVWQIFYKWSLADYRFQIIRLKLRKVIVIMLRKVMQRMLNDIIMINLHINCVIVKSQQTFMQQWSCLVNLLIIEERLTKLLENGNTVDIVFLDFA